METNLDEKIDVHDTYAKIKQEMKLIDSEPERLELNLDSQIRSFCKFERTSISHINHSYNLVNNTNFGFSPIKEELKMDSPIFNSSEVCSSTSNHHQNGPLTDFSSSLFRSGVEDQRQNSSSETTSLEQFKDSSFSVGPY